MAIVVCGSDGQLGAALVRAFRATLGDAAVIVALGRDALDITDENAVRQVVGHLRPHLVVNAAAMTDVDACEQNPQRARRCNALGPWLLAQAAADVGARLVTLSTDYVFAGRDAPYDETCRPDPVNVYGATKAAGEHHVRTALDDHQIVRTAWLMGPTGRNFATAILHAARQDQTLEVVDDQIGSPTLVSELAAAIVELALEAPAGTWHRTNQGVVSRYELARALVADAGLDVPVIARATREGERPACRPGRVALDNSRAHQEGLLHLRPWRDAVGEFVEQVSRR